MKRFTCLFLLLPMLAGLWACNEETLVEPRQSGSIGGIIRYKTNLKPVSNAVARLSPTGLTVETDTTGAFRFPGVPVGKYTLQVTKAGCRNEVATVEAVAGVASETTLLLTGESNAAPTPTGRPFPADGTTALPTTVALRWKATDPENDLLTYDLTLYRQGTLFRTFTGLKADSLVLEGLTYGSNYTWQVVFRDAVNAVNGPVWSFSTRPFPAFAYVYARKVEGRYQIFTSNGSGEEIQLTRDGSNWRPVAGPATGSNRVQIAFLSNADTEQHLYVMDADGANLRRVTSVPVGGSLPTDLSFCWSPDGTRLLYPANDKLYSVRADGTGLTRVAQAPAGRFFTGCDWTSQGNRIAARTVGTGSLYDNRILLMTPEGKDTSTVLALKSRISNPVFSIDGTRLLFSLDRGSYQDEQGRQTDARLMLLDVKTRSLLDLSGEKNGSGESKAVGSNDLEPRFSPNGARIIFVNTDNTGTGPRRILTVGIDGKGREQAVASGEMPDWKQ
ncbi:carboxypeptidase regulatory-like domain-containing protein [Larkinella soli]|uniref:carboxypeptidase regulatory-like domain-containing protein n=1 Tax=Larkinella soli TaxID=1770527 RepID=UPI000FFB4F2F|nr:carboxypeptidase regulatory-like domain-containing protein [Larkinella soli]